MDPSKLVELGLTDNRLTGPIPVELTTISTLENFYVHINRLSGTIPTQIGQLTNLRSLFLSNNDFTGTIPTEIGNPVIASASATRVDTSGEPNTT